MAALRLRAPEEVAHLSDPELVRAAGAGDEDAFAELYRRHTGAARRVAQRVLGGTHDVADAVAEAFTRVFAAIAGGRVPEAGFRPYLLAATRNAATDQLRRAGRVAPIADLSGVERTRADLPRGARSGAGPSDALLAGEDSALLVQAFRDLPDRWQVVLWLTEVDGVPPRDAAARLGLSANNVSQLAVRARARLRERYLQAHVRNHARPECQGTVDRLGAYLAGTLAAGPRRGIDEHLGACAACRARLAEVEDMGSLLRRAILPVPAMLGASTAKLPRPPHHRLGRQKGRGLLRTGGPEAQPSLVTRAAESSAGLAPPSATPLLTTAAPAVQALGTSPVAVLAPVIVAEPLRRAVARAASAVLAALAAIVPGGAGGGNGAAVHPMAPGPAVVDTIAPPPSASALPPSPPPAPAPSVTPVVPGPGSLPDPGPPAATSHPYSTAARPLGTGLDVYDAPGAPTPSLRFEDDGPRGIPLVFLVMESRGDWIRLLLPVRPNGTTAWARRSDVSLTENHYSVVVQLGAHQITLFDGTQIELREPIAVGTQSTPTPGGLYFTNQVIRPAPGGAYGAYIVGLSGYSNALSHFADGDPVIGIHGSNDTSALGHDVSHGCIRMSNAGVSRLASLPVGIPVEIRP